MMIDVRDVLDSLDLAIGRVDGVLPAEAVEHLGERARRLRVRNGFIGEVLVVALAGGTGSGKSSLVNALVGSAVVPTGIVRPTTQHATAIVGTGAPADLGPMFDAVGVDDRIPRPEIEATVLIDLPDFDSTEEAHRHVVESVVPRVDAVVWVLDPEKYADPVLHDGFLRHMADHASQFVFVLNQADRLGPGLTEALDALTGLLRTDGFAEPTVVSTRAAPLEDADVAGLVAVLDDRWDAKATALAKMGLDARRIAADGWVEVGEVDPGPRGDLARDAIALARATFVSLGVAAYELHHRYAGLGDPS